MTPGDERVVAVRCGAKKGDERSGILGADSAVERKTGGVAQGLERESGANAVGGVGAGVERVDAEIEAAVVERFKVVDVSLRASLTGAREFATEQGLFSVTHDEHGVAGELIVRDRCGGVKREGECSGEERRAKRRSSF